jgi:hypothetical protein
MAYAVAADLTGWVDPIPADADELLESASEMLDSEVLFAAVYDVDDDGAPTDPLVIEAFKRAVCAQVQWWDELGDSIGAMGAGWGATAIGGLSMSRSVTSVSGSDAASQQFGPKVARILRSPKLTGRLRLGVVVSC